MASAELIEVRDAKTEEIKYLQPIPTRVSKKAIWAYAEEQRKKSQLSNGFELADLIRKNGGKIEYISIFDAHQTDAIKVNPDGTYVIRVSSLTGALRDNFTIAHELGHRLLHWPLVKKTDPHSGMVATRSVDTTKSDLVRCEWEANWFASAFLMPEEEFTVAFKNGFAAERFGVTSSAVLVRAKSLGLN